MVDDHLAAALRAAETRAWADALGPLLTVWRDRPSVALATAIEEVSARALEHVPQPIAQTAGTLNAMWFTQAKKGDPAVIGQLCTTLRNTRRSNDLVRRIEMLLAHGTDPRLAMAVCDVVEHSTYPVLQLELEPFWSRVFSWLPELGDPRVLERAHAFPGTWETKPEADRAALLARLDDTMPALIAAYPEREPLDFADRETCFAIARAARTLAPGDDRADEAALLAAIYAAPDADEPRTIYADWLEQRGSPRGEFIALQLAKTRASPTPAQAGRERALLHTFAAEWRAPLTRAEFARGFISESSDAELLGQDPRLATLVRSNSVPESDDTHVPVLRRIDKADDPQIVRLASLEKPLAVEHLGWFPSFFVDGLPQRSAALDAFARIRVLPQLRSLLISHSGPSWTWSELTVLPMPEILGLLAAPCMRALRTLEMRYPIVELADLVATLAPSSLDRLAITAMDHYEICELVFERDPRGRLGTLAIHFRTMLSEIALVNGVLEAISELPPDQLTRVRIDLSLIRPADRRDLRERFDNALRRQTALDELAF
jgi:uncharacterized protein (TIGR02996 family)